MHSCVVRSDRKEPNLESYYSHTVSDREESFLNVKLNLMSLPKSSPFLLKNEEDSTKTDISDQVGHYSELSKEPLA